MVKEHVAVASRSNPGASARSNVPASAIRKQGLPPQIPKTAHVLMLGSFPGEESLKQSQYYAHPRNQFWRLMGDILDQPLADLPNQERLRRLAQHRVGVWDIITGCERKGSLDGDIRQAAFSQFEWLAKHAPRLRVVALNGQKAGTARTRIEALGYEVIVLPSSSPAFTLSYEKKLEAWLVLREHLAAR
jgi:hypoxanthine-DNA glycosylase